MTHPCDAVLRQFTQRRSAVATIMLSGTGEPSARRAIRVISTRPGAKSPSAPASAYARARSIVSTTTVSLCCPGGCWKKTSVRASMKNGIWAASAVCRACRMRSVWSTFFAEFSVRRKTVFQVATYGPASIARPMVLPTISGASLEVVGTSLRLRISTVVPAEDAQGA